MTDTWHTELTQDGDRWSFTLTQNGIWHSGRTASGIAADGDTHPKPPRSRPLIGTSSR